MAISSHPAAKIPVAGSIIIYREKVPISTRQEFDVVDVTEAVQNAIMHAGVEEGYALVYCPHTTCAVIINERESGLLADIRRTLERLVPPLDNYLHDDFDIRTENMNEGETKNAHSHLRQLIAGRTSEHIAVGEGSLLLGAWQRVMFIELDRAREREVLIQVCGI
ncbi:MAG: secondary thiamine-phosphate synthase enzyme YjbQ [Actinomycetota bacterium]|nr:secondary thiamine-phosphate synthase enzyme YjbQ [Actinomycetota bacterium]